MIRKSGLLLTVSLPVHLRLGLALALALAGLLVLVALSFTTSAQTSQAPGDVDTTFDPGDGADGTVQVLALQSDDKVLIGGDFTQVDNTERSYIARLNADGSLDTGFDPGIGPDSGVRAVAVQSETKVIIGGLFTTVTVTATNHIARLDSDGSLDPGFDPGDGPNGAVLAIAVQTDSKVIIGGSFTAVDSIPRGYVARLNADGSLDTSFLNGLAGADGAVHAVALQPDGKVLIGGEFIVVNTTMRRRVARLNSDGSLDTTFDPGTGASDQVRAVAVQPNGKILVGGAFTGFGSSSSDHIVRLNTDGSVDATFDSGAGANNWVRAIEVQDDGKVLIGGTFTVISGTSRAYIARLNVDGSPDITFGITSSPNGSVRDIAIQSDGKVIIGGLFTAVDGTPRNRIARLSSRFANQVYLPLVLRGGP
jgi:uncharacterized delta-60 repeat protein